MALRYHSIQQPHQQLYPMQQPQQTQRSSSSSHYQLHNCQPTPATTQLYNQQQRLAAAAAIPLSSSSSSSMKCASAGNSSFYYSNNNNGCSSSIAAAAAAAVPQQWGDPRSSTAVADQHQNHHRYTARCSSSSQQPQPQQQQQQQHQQQILLQQQRSAARLAQQHQPIIASPYNSAVTGNSSSNRSNNSRPQQDINPWISSFAYNKQPQAFSSLKPATNQQLLMPASSGRSARAIVADNSDSKTATTTTKIKPGNKIRSTIESLFRNNNKEVTTTTNDGEVAASRQTTANQQQQQQQQQVKTGGRVAVDNNNNNNNNNNSDIAGHHHHLMTTVTEPASQPQPPRKNKWRSIPGIRRSLSNLFVQQKHKPPPPSVPAIQAAIISSNSNNASITALHVEDDCPSFVARRELELQMGRQNATCPQAGGPLVRLRHGDESQQNRQQRINSTNTLSSSSGASSSVAMTTSRQSTSMVGDGTSADSGYSPTEPEMILVPHPAATSTSKGHHQFKPQLSTSMYLQRSGHPNELELDFDIYERTADKSLESLMSSCDNRRIVTHRGLGDDGEVDDDESKPCDWPPPHMRNRTAISSPNIPRLVRRNNLTSTNGVQRFRPEVDTQQAATITTSLPPAAVDEEFIDDEDDDDFCEDDELDTGHDYLSTTQPCMAPTGSLCRLTMSSFGAPNDLAAGQRQLRRPRRVRAVSDHSLHRRSKDQRRQQERDFAAGDTASLHQDHQAFLASLAAASSGGNGNGMPAMPNSTLVKSATLGALATSHKSRHAPKILSDVPRAEFTLANSTTFFNKSESSLLDKNPPPPQLHQQHQQNETAQQGRPLPVLPPTVPQQHHHQQQQQQQKQRPPIPPTSLPIPVGQRNSSMILQSSSSSSSAEQTPTNNFIYGRSFTIPDPSSTTGLTFEITPLITPANSNNNCSISSNNVTGSNQLVNKQNGTKSQQLSSQGVVLAPLARLTATVPPGIPCSSSSSPNSSASSSVENAPSKNAFNGNPVKLTTNNNTSPAASTPTTEEGSDLQQQEQVFRRFGCQRLLEMQRRIEENCRLSERQQNEQEAVTRLLTNIRRNMRTTEI